MCGKGNSMNKNEKIVIAWCDSGKVEGAFASGIIRSLLSTDISNQFSDLIRSKGFKISTQRQEVFDVWMLPDFDDTDWILWLDSDIEIDYNVLKCLMDSADKDTAPIVSGLYFTTASFDENGLPVPTPCFFQYEEKTSNRQWGAISMDVENDPAMIKVDSIGFGMVLMHRSIGKKLVEHFGNKHLFLEIQHEEDHSYFWGEDVVFCMNLKEINVPIYVNTRAIPSHWKSVPIDNNYHKLYYESKGVK
jgi:hypothetical protein